MFSPVKYFSEVTQELRQVTWPSRDQTIEMTILVIGVSLVIGAYLGGIDYIFNAILTQTLLQ
ncbi:MAG: preprotein translocase subunit SecE [Patescibacteria group bacterium]